MFCIAVTKCAQMLECKYLDTFQCSLAVQMYRAIRLGFEPQMHMPNMHIGVVYPTCVSDLFFRRAYKRCIVGCIVDMHIRYAYRILTSGVLVEAYFLSGACLLERLGSFGS